MKQILIALSDFLKEQNIERKIDKFECDIGYPSNISVNLQAFKILDEAVFVKVAAEGTIALECSRCLDVYNHPLEIYFEKEMDFLSNQVDVGEELRQQIILEIPSKPLCCQDCLGICPVCGKHNMISDKCSCASPNDDFVKQRWQDLLDKINLKTKK